MQDVSKQSFASFWIALIAAGGLGGALLAAPAWADPAANKPDAKVEAKAKSHSKTQAEAESKTHAKTAAKTAVAKTAAKPHAKSHAKTEAKAHKPADTQRVAVPMPQDRPGANNAKAAPAARAPLQLVPTALASPASQGSDAYAQAGAGLRGAMFASRATLKPLARPVAGPFAIAPTSVTSDADIAALKRVSEAARKGSDGEADAAERSIADPVARKLAEYMILRSYNTKPSFERYANFITQNPDWPHVPLFRAFPDGVPAETRTTYLRRVLSWLWTVPQQPCPWCGEIKPVGALDPCGHLVCRACWYGGNFAGCPVCGRRVATAATSIPRINAHCVTRSMPISPAPITPTRMVLPESARAARSRARPVR